MKIFINNTIYEKIRKNYNKIYDEKSEKHLEYIRSNLLGMDNAAILQALDNIEKRMYNKVNVCSRRSNDMAISYNKLWKLLVDKKMSKADLRKAAGIAPNTMTRLRRDEEVTLTVLHKICKTLKA